MVGAREGRETKETKMPGRSVIRTGNRGLVRTPNRRITRWLSQTTFFTTSPEPSTAVLMGTFTAAEQAEAPFTIIRVRGWMHIRSDQTAATEDFAGVLGFAVVKATATAIGITAIPTPITEPNDDWFVFEPISGSLQNVSNVGFDANAGVSQRFDSKAMRKVDVGDDLAIVFEVPASGLSEGVEFTLYSRVLIKLH